MATKTGNGTDPAALLKAREAIAQAESETSAQCQEEIEQVLSKYGRSLFAKSEVWVDDNGFVRSRAVTFIGPSGE